MAPVLEQVYKGADFDSELERYYDRYRADLGLQVFGFHMVGSMGGKHSGYEHDLFTYPMLKGRSPEETQDLLHQVQDLMHEASEQAENVSRLLQRAMQETAAVTVEWNADEHGHLNIKSREKKTAADFDFGRDTLTAFWIGVGQLLPGFLEQIALNARDSDTLSMARFELLHSWGQVLARQAKRLYRPHFDHYSTQPKTMPFAHYAARRFYGVLKKITRALAEPEDAS